MSKVKKHIAKRGNKVVVVKQHERNQERGRKITSSFLERISERDGGGYDITIGGKKYPYPYLPDELVGGVIRGKDNSSGRYYNLLIRGKYF